MRVVAQAFVVGGSQFHLAGREPMFLANECRNARVYDEQKRRGPDVGQEKVLVLRRGCEVTE